jgi:CRISPR/Cas system-associated protein Csm6
MTRLGGARFERLLDLMGDGAAADLATAAANAENVGRWLERMQATLGDLRALLAKEPTALEAEMKQLLAARAEWDRHGEEAPTPMPERASTLRRLFLGRG